MGPDSPRALVLDTGALIAIERRDRGVAALVATANRNDLHVVAPAGALARAWRGGRRQALLARAIRTDLEVDDLETRLPSGPEPCVDEPAPAT